jgi:serine beta-lactamase-like protein LACTB
MLMTLCVDCLGLICFISGAWIVVLMLAEHTRPFAGPALPNCGAWVADRRYERAVARARAQIQAMMAEQHIPGLAVAAAIDGQLVWSEGLGYADRERQIPACPQTQFRTASVSKLLTAAAAAQLAEQGHLDLDTPIQRYVPTFPEKGTPITARELATHRSGIRHYRDDREALNQRRYPTVTDSLRVRKASPRRCR